MPVIEGLTLRPVSDVAPHELEWIMHPYLPLGTQVAVVGGPGAGKSTLLAGLHAHCTGGATLSGPPRRGGRTLLLPGERDAAEARELLTAAGARLDQVIDLTAAGPGRIYLPGHLGLIERAIRLTGAVLLTMDPIDSYLGEDCSENCNADVRSVLEPLGRIALDTGCVIAWTRHPGKDPSNVMVGSRAWRAVPRTILWLCIDPVTRQGRLVHYKPAVGAPAPVRYYDLAGAGDRPRLFVVGEPVDDTTQRILEAAPLPGERFAVDEATRWLKGRFEGPERVWAAPCVKAAKADGIGEKSLREARRLLGVKARREMFGGAVFYEAPEGGWPPWLS